MTEVTVALTIEQVADYEFIISFCRDWRPNKGVSADRNPPKHLVQRIEEETGPFAIALPRHLKWS